MKKALLIATLALSMNAFAQFSNPGSDPKEKIQGRIEYKEFNHSGITPELNREQDTRHLLQPADLIMVFDSIHYWIWDTLSISWKVA